MYVVRKRDGTLTKDYREILNEQRLFYQDLYKVNPNVSFNLVNNSGVFLSEEDKVRLDQDISIGELKEALKSMKPEKTPGCDGLSREFYLKFIDKVGIPMLNMFKLALIEGKLCATARRGVIQLIPKHNKDETLVKSWRPLTILPYDYRILARILAIRFESVTQDLISPCQQGFLKNRNIACNIRKTAEVIAYTKKRRQKAIIVTIDFDKCFDRVEFNSIAGALRYFNFGTQFTRWIMLLYQDCLLCTQNNGYVSDWFAKTRGCAQGCPVSPTCFLFCSEVMTHLIKQHSSIKGISINELEEILSQFADDTSLFLKWDQDCLNALCEVLSQIEANIGLRVSYDKTTLYRIGSLSKTSARLYTAQDFKWSNDDIHVLGVYLACDGKSCGKKCQ